MPLLRRFRQLHYLHRLLPGLVAVAFLAIGMPPCAGMMGDVQAAPMPTMEGGSDRLPYFASHREHGQQAELPAPESGCHGNECVFLKAAELPKADSDTTLQLTPSIEPAPVARAELALPEPPPPAFTLLPAERLPASPVMEHRVLRI